MTTNLWTQGAVPERYRPRLPDNARFVEDEGPGVFPDLFGQAKAFARSHDRLHDATEAARGCGFSHRLLVSEALFSRHVIEPGGTRLAQSMRLHDIIFAAKIALGALEGKPEGSEVQASVWRGEDVAADLSVSLGRDESGGTTVSVFLDAYYPEGVTRPPRSLADPDAVEF